MTASAYTPELWDRVLERLWSGETATAIAADLGITDRTLTNWSNKDDDHKAQWQEAMEHGARALIEQVVPLVDDIGTDPDASSRKVRAWARIEVAKRKAPHLFGDKVQHAHGGINGEPIRYTVVTGVPDPKPEGDRGG